MKTITENNISWVDIEKPIQKDLDWLKRNFNIHAVTLNELVSLSSREKVEQFPDYLFLVMYEPIFNVKKRTTRPVELDIILAKDKLNNIDYLITVHNEPIEPLNDFYNKIKEKSDSRLKYFDRDSGHLFYWLSEELLNFAERQLVHISKNISRIEDDMFKSVERKLIKEISTAKRDILDFRVAIRPLNRIFNSLANQASKFWLEKNDDLKVYFTDLINDYERILNEVDNYAETINSLENTNTNLLNDKTNSIVKTFTIMSFITFPTMLLIAILQINSPENPIFGKPNDFWIIIGIVALLIFSMLAYFKSKKWL